MSRFPALSVVEETKVVALLARGDTYQQIIDSFPGRPHRMSDKTIQAVKKRNAESLALLRQKSLEKANEDASAIKEKANKKISQRLDTDEKNRRVMEKAKNDVLEGNLTWKEYHDILKLHKDLSIPELVSVSKEMHNQSIKEDDSERNPGDFASLVAAIRSGDEVKLTQAVFNAKLDTPPVPATPPVQTV